MASPNRVLAVVAHPDDESWCSGLLAAQVDAGLEVHLGIVSNGNLGGMPELTPKQRGDTRHREAERAAEVIGCHLHFLDIGDDELMEHYTNRYVELEWRLRDLVREADPELMIVPALDDYHQHHRLVAEVALNASTGAANSALVSEKPPSSCVPTVLHIQPLPPAPFAPDLYVDISSTAERKFNAFLCHESQHSYLQSHHRTDFLELVRSTARLHGMACSVEYAEAYTLCRRWNRTATVQALAPFFPAATG